MKKEITDEMRKYESMEYCPICDEDTKHYGSEVIGICCSMCNNYIPDEIEEGE